MKLYEIKSDLQYFVRNYFDLEKELKRRKENASKAKFARTLTFSGVVIVAFTIIAATRIFNVLQVSGNSMEPTLYSGDLLISSKILGYEKGDLPITEAYADTVISLPVYNGMTLEEQKRIIDCLNAY